MSNNLLITGISGFVGSNIVKYLSSESKIYGLDIVNNDNEKIAATFDWKDLDSLPNVDAIIHLAGKAHDTSNTADSESYFKINFGLTKTIYDYFIKSESKVFIFFSSVKAAADTLDNETLTENVLPRPLTAYGQSKLKAERYILNQSPQEGQKVYILRPAMIHGPGNKGNLNLLYSIVENGIPYPLGTFQNKRSFLSVDNMNFIISRLLDGEVPSGIYNVCDDEPLSTTKIVEMIYSSIGKTHRILNISQPLIRALAKLGDIIGLPLNSERLKKMTESYIVSNEKIKKVLSINSLPITSQRGMYKTIMSFTQR